MLNRRHALPFTSLTDGRITVGFLRDADGRVVAFLDRLLRLLRRLEGRDRATILEALKRQERRVRDVTRLSGIAKTLLDSCTFDPPPGAERAPEVRDALFGARGALWPPVPGDETVPYETAALALYLNGGGDNGGSGGADGVARLLYADSPAARILTRAPRIDGRTLLDRYNTNLARAVLLDATRVVLSARGGWRSTFRAVKLARLMYTLERAGRTRRTYRLTLTGPASPYLVRPQRYGIRFARALPAFTRAPGWRIEAEITRDGRRLHYSLGPDTLPVTRRRGRPRYDSSFEQALAAEFAAKMGTEREGWTLARESTPVSAGESLFLPDFTARHRDGREALIEIVGFWTPEYLAAKLEKLRAARADNLVLVVYRGLDAGGRTAEALATAAADAPVVWFENRPRIGPVMDAVRRVAR